MNRALHLTALAAVTGGAAWVAKFAAIAAADGDAPEAVTSVLYLGGVLLMVVGAATVTLRLAPTRPRQAVAILLAPVVAFASYAALETVGQAVVGDSGPAWLHDEIGIAMTGAAWLAVGLWAVRDSAGAAGGARTGAVSLDRAAS